MAARAETLLGKVLPGGARRRTGAGIAEQRPGPLAYAFLAAILLASAFPLYWSFLIGSGTSGTLNDQDMSWLPGGNFLVNAASVINNPSVNFWKALGNSLIVSTVVSASVIFFSTLAGYAFAKLRFRGR